MNSLPPINDAKGYEKKANCAFTSLAGLLMEQDPEITAVKIREDLQAMLSHKKVDISDCVGSDIGLLFVRLYEQVMGYNKAENARETFIRQILGITLFLRKVGFAGGDIEGITIFNKKDIDHKKSYKLLASEAHKQISNLPQGTQVVFCIMEGDEFLGPFNAHWLLGEVGPKKTVRYEDYQMNTEGRSVGISSYPMRPFGEAADEEDLAVYIVVKPKVVDLDKAEEDFWEPSQVTKKSVDIGSYHEHKQGTETKKKTLDELAVAISDIKVSINRVERLVKKETDSKPVGKKNQGVDDKVFWV